MIDRRDFIRMSALLGTGALVGDLYPPTLKRVMRRGFSLCTNTEILNKNPDFLNLAGSSGVTDIWMPLFLNGYWAYPIEDIMFWKKRIEKKGIAVYIISVPFGHPGNSLGEIGRAHV